ncbi:DegT/DnrJ/EryC1/StrS family aminotransferase [Streptomyces kebangsaanensis]|uniref:DegT/DnrJ/EryC1/StrS family aminotransferase n=1 Tax=Streptomyces kebangsaanensis TaxID=864058 RepID=UPI00093BE3BA|nr:DegT/DnrJ/EryC1/StrS family aminotransferase [Streptomyces kebangsaanensis]
MTERPHQLAMLGGPRAVPPETAAPRWPVVTRGDEEAVARVLTGGRLTATAEGEEEVPGLEREWAAYTGTAHCAAVGSGTAALQLALAALGVGPGDEVVVPAVSMNATALAVVQQGARPVFADIDPETYTMDPDAVRAVAGPRTKALLPVHLHGLPADMDALRTIAAELGAAVVEDAAQSHGAAHRGRRTGALGTVGCFSLHPSKNLPTCGEGGLLTTDDPDIHERVLRLRQFGEDPRPRRTRSYVSHIAGWNHRIGPVEAAFARSQLARLDEYGRRRAPGVLAFLDRLASLPGLLVPVVPKGSVHAWHILRFRLDPQALGLADEDAAALRRALHRALRAEGVPVSRYQEEPLPAHPAFTPHVPAGARFPVARAVLTDSLCLQRRHLDPGSGPVLAAYADGFEKVWQHLDLIRRMVRSASPAARGRQEVSAV